MDYLPGNTSNFHAKQLQQVWSLVTTTGWTLTSLSNTWWSAHAQTTKALKQNYNYGRIQESVQMLSTDSNQNLTTTKPGNSKMEKTRKCLSVTHGTIHCNIFTRLALLCRQLNWIYVMLLIWTAFESAAKTCPQLCPVCPCPSVCKMDTQRHRKIKIGSRPSRRPWL